MSESKGTPGPWSVRVQSGWADHPADGRSMLNVQVYGPTGSTVEEVRARMERDLNAAPALRDALERVILMLGENAAINAASGTNPATVTLLRALEANAKSIARAALALAVRRE